MAYKYISSSGKEYNLFYSKVSLKGGKLAKIYFLLPEGKQPTNKIAKAYLAESLPNAYEVREVGKSKTPLVYKVRTSYE